MLGLESECGVGECGRHYFAVDKCGNLFALLAEYLFGVAPAHEALEAENLQIVQLVRSMRLTPQELTAMLSGGGIPGIAAAPADYDGQEGSGNEE